MPSLAPTSPSGTRPAEAGTARVLSLVLAFLVLLAQPAAHADELGTIGATADSLIRVTSSVNCTPGPMCVEAIGLLPLGNYSLDGLNEVVAEGAVDHAGGTITGSLRIENAVGLQANGVVQFAARDEFTVTGPLPGEAISVTARLQLAGTVTRSDIGFTTSVDAVLSHGPGSWNTVNGGISGAGAGDGATWGVFSEGTSTFDLEAVSTFGVTTGTPFDVSYAMWQRNSYIDGFPAGDLEVSTIDSLSGAQLSFDLPTGYTISSVLGFPAPPPAPAAPVPALSSWAAAGLGLAMAGIGFRASRRPTAPEPGASSKV